MTGRQPRFAALRHDRITAPCVFDPDQRRKLPCLVQQALVPTLSAGDIVIMDNLSSHKVAAYRYEAIEAVGATPLYLKPVVFLQPRWLNPPIEQVFAKP